VIRKAHTVSAFHYICPGRKNNTELLYLSRYTILNISKECPDNFTVREQQGQLNICHTCNIHNCVAKLQGKKEKFSASKCFDPQSLKFSFF